MWRQKFCGKYVNFHLNDSDIGFDLNGIFLGVNCGFSFFLFLAFFHWLMKDFFFIFSPFQKNKQGTSKYSKYKQLVFHSPSKI